MSNFSINSGTISGNISGFYNESRERSEIPVPVYSTDGNARMTFSLCHNTSRKGSNGEWVEVPHFFEFTIFGKVATTLADQLVIGQGVTVQYELRQDSWQDSSGQKRTKVNFLVQAVVPGRAPKGKSNASPAPVPVDVNPDLIPF